MSTTQAIRTSGDVVRPARSAVATVLVLATLGVLLGGLAGFSGPRHTAGASILLTGVDAPGRGNLYAVGKYVLDRAKTWAMVAESDAVVDAAAARLGEPVGALSGAVKASAPTTTTLLEIRVEAPDPAQAIRWAEAVAIVAADTIAAQEVPRDAAGPRVTASVISVDDVTRDARFLAIRLAAVLGGVLGILAGWTVLAVRRPGRWLDRLHRPLDARGQDFEMRRIDQHVQIEVLGALLLGQSARGVLIVLFGLFGIFGFALTGSPLPPLLVVVAAGVAACKDLRFAAGAILFAGISVLPSRVEIIDLGLLTPTVLEVSIAIGIVLVLVKRRRGRPMGPFTGPVLAVLGALFCGLLVGMANGAELTEVIVPARAILTLLAFFVIREAFRGRPYQLFAIVLILGTVSSVIAVLGVPLNLELLQSLDVEYVVTGSETANVSRLNPPVLQLWSPLLVVLAAGVIRLRPRWLWVLLLAPCIALEALSFNRTTWATLVILVVVVAVLRGGRRALLVRAGGLVVAGALALGGLQVGMLGAEGEAIADRLTSVITGNALGEDSLSDRLRENVEAWKTLSDSPVVGTGLSVPYGGELTSYNANLNVLVVEDRPWIHNQYLRLWLWMGVAGLLAYGWFGIRVFAFSFFDRLRRGGVSTITVASAVGLGGIAAQSLLATTLDYPPVIISIALTIAIMELSGAPTRSDADPDTPWSDLNRRTDVPARPMGV